MESRRTRRGGRWHIARRPFNRVANQTHGRRFTFVCGLLFRFDCQTAHSPYPPLEGEGRERSERGGVNSFTPQFTPPRPPSLRLAVDPPPPGEGEARMRQRPYSLRRRERRRLFPSPAIAEGRRAESGATVTVRAPFPGTRGRLSARHPDNASGLICGGSPYGAGPRF
jgi:hypothetical protein